MIHPSVVPPEVILSPEAEALYHEMVSSGRQPHSDEESAAHALLGLGLLRNDPCDGYVVVDPGYAGTHLQAGFYGIAATYLQQAVAITDALRGVRAAYEQRVPTAGGGLIEMLRSSDAINWRLGQILSGATQELLFAQPGTQRRAAAIAEASERDLAALRRGVTSRTLYQEEARTGPGMDAWASMMISEGAQIRTLNSSFERCFIVDRRIAVIPGDRILMDSTEAVAYVVNDPGVAGFLAQRFDRDWDSAVDWNRPDDVPALLTAREEALLRGLEAGIGRDALARQLNISASTFATAVTTVKEKLGNPKMSAFELGCRWMEYQATDRSRAAIARTSAAGAEPSETSG